MKKEYSKLNLRWKIVIFLITIIFVFIRLYKVDTTLNFFGDIGRDFFTLHSWIETKKPPLLGPQTSVISFNQSAIYFYYLLPFYLLFNQSIFSTIYATIFLYLFFYFSGLIYYRKNIDKQKLITCIFGLIAIHPQFILQSRLPWNPVLAPPLLIGGFLLLEELTIKFSDKKEWLATMLLAIAVSLTYSLTPTVFIVLIFYLWSQKSVLKSIKTIFKLFVSFSLTNLPTIAFEFRHDFLLTRSVLSQEPLQTIVLSFKKLSELVSIPLAINAGLVIPILIVVAAIVLFRKRNQAAKSVLFILGAVFLAQYLLPFKTHSHYIFGIISLVLILVGKINSKFIKTIFITILLISWLKPAQIEQYFAPTKITIQEKQSCAKTACEELEFPLFLTLNSSSHDHQAFGYRYLFSKAGCQVKDLAYEPNLADRLVVVSENTRYDLGKTDYHEISLFKPTKIERLIECGDKLTLSVLSNLD